MRLIWEIWKCSRSLILWKCHRILRILSRSGLLTSLTYNRITDRISLALSRKQSGLKSINLVHWSLPFTISLAIPIPQADTPAIPTASLQHKGLYGCKSDPLLAWEFRHRWLLNYDPILHLLDFIWLDCCRQYPCTYLLKSSIAQADRNRHMKQTVW